MYMYVICFIYVYYCRYQTHFRQPTTLWVHFSYAAKPHKNLFKMKLIFKKKKLVIFNKY